MQVVIRFLFAASVVLIAVLIVKVNSPSTMSRPILIAEPGS